MQRETMPGTPSRKIKCLLLLWTSCVFLSFPLQAEDLSGILIRLDNLETDNRALRELIENLTHTLSLKEKKEEESAKEDASFLTEKDSTLVESEDESPTLSSPEETYKKALATLEQGDYEDAEKAFERFLKAYPDDQHAGPAQYWLGVTFFAREQHDKAVAHFAKGHKRYPKSSKAVQNLLKLAEALKALGREEDACTTLDQLAENSKASASQVAEARRKMGCKQNS